MTAEIFRSKSDVRRAALACVFLVYGHDATAADEADPVLARVGDRKVLASEFEQAYRDQPNTFDMATIDGRRALLLELINKEILEACALERYPETPQMLVRSMEIFRDSTRRAMTLELLAPDAERRRVVIDSLRSAHDVTLMDDGIVVLQRLYEWVPLTDDPMEYLKVQRQTPIPAPEEEQVLVVSFSKSDDWNVQDVVRRLEKVPSGLWPRGDSPEQVVMALNMLTREFLLDQAAADLHVESKPEYVSSVDRRDRNMRTKLFYHQDIIGDLQTITRAEVEDYYSANAARYNSHRFEDIEDTVTRHALTARRDARLNEFLATKRAEMSVTIDEDLLRRIPGLEPLDQRP